MVRTGIAKRVVAAGVIGLAAVGFSRSPLAAAAGLDVWSLPALKEQLDEAAVRRAVLDEKDEAVSQRIVLKDHLMNDLVAGRTTLAAATDTFLALNDGTDTEDAVRHQYPTAGEREAAARNVMRYAELYPQPTPGRRAAALARLAAEYRAMFPPGPR